MKHRISLIILLFLLQGCKQDFIKIKATSTTENKSIKNDQVAITKSTPKTKKSNNAMVAPTPSSRKSPIPAAVTINKAKAKSKINHKKIDISLLEALMHEEINKVRSKNRLPILTRHEILEKAALDQNNYCLKNTDLTHTQLISFKRTLPDRIKYYGGGFQIMAENLIYEGFTVRTVNGVKKEIITPTYQKMAKTLVKNWLNSPPHRKNIMSGEVDRVGNAIAYNPSNYAIYATQVFGKK